MVSLRGHHLICLHFFRGQGYSKEFIEHLSHLIESARTLGGRVSSGADDVCSACPYVDGRSCAYAVGADKEVRDMDDRALALLGYAEGDHWKWDDLLGKSASVFHAWFAQECAGCRWRANCEEGDLFRSLRDAISLKSCCPKECAARDGRTIRGADSSRCGSVLEGGESLAFRKGTLWQRVVDSTDHALRVGALVRIPTKFRLIEDAGVQFVVRVVSSLSRKDEALRKEMTTLEGKGPRNPFSPFEKDLFVCDISASHVALLNKFNVVDHHLLIVTREFEDQEMLLTPEDFEALWACMEEYEGLGFYNGGREAGASQSHKHLQLVPLPLAHSGSVVPIEPLFASVDFADTHFGRVPRLPFLHSFTRFDQQGVAPQFSVETVFQRYCGMLQSVGISPPESASTVRQSAPYCLLITRKWMLLVPRLRECYGSISINSLGFAGAMLVRSEDEMNQLEAVGPMMALKAVSFPQG